MTISKPNTARHVGGVITSLRSEDCLRICQSLTRIFLKFFSKSAQANDEEQPPICPTKLQFIKRI